METLTKQIGGIVEILPQEKQELVLQLVTHLLPDDDLATNADLADIKTAHKEYRAGETVSFDNIDWD